MDKGLQIIPMARLIAGRYQVMVKWMVFRAAGISSACFFNLNKPLFVRRDECKLLSTYQTP